MFPLACIFHGWQLVERLAKLCGDQHDMWKRSYGTNIMMRQVAGRELSFLMEGEMCCPAVAVMVSFKIFNENYTYFIK